MKISSVGLYNGFNFKPIYKAQPAFCGLKEDVFEKRADTKSQKVPFGVDRSFLEENTLLNTKYEQISPKIKEAAKESAFAGKITKEMYDEKYGKNNWVFVSIGTSPAGIGKALEYMGVDVKYVPISNLDALLCANFKEIFAKNKKTGIYRAFLNSIGLGKKQISKDKRKYIVADYAASGTSLEIASDITRLYLKINNSNITFNEINNSLIEYTQSRYSQEDCDRIQKYILKYMRGSHIENVCGIPHLKYDNIDNIQNLLKENKPKEAQDFEYALCNHLKYGVKNEN